MGLGDASNNNNIIVFSADTINAAGDRLSEKLFNKTGRGGSLYVHTDITARVTATLQVSIRIKDPATGKTVTIGTPTNHSSIGTFTQFYSQASGLVGVPAEFWINVNHSDATATTYSVGVQVVG